MKENLNNKKKENNKLYNAPVNHKLHNKKELSKNQRPHHLKSVKVL